MIGTPIGPSEFSEWFPKYRELVESLVRDMDDLLGDQFDLDKPALAVELADTAWRWAQADEHSSGGGAA